MHHELDTVEVFDLAPRPKRLAFAANRYIGIATQRSLVHVAIRCAYTPQQLPKFPHIGSSLLRRAQHGCTDNLHESDTCAVVIQQADATPRIRSRIHRFTRVLLKLQLLNGHVQRCILRGEVTVFIPDRYKARVRKRLCVSTKNIRRFWVIW